MKKIALLFLIITVSFLSVNCKNINKTSKIITLDTSFKFEAGDYNISWEGSPFKTTLTKIDAHTLTGRFCVNNYIDKCKDIGPITITRHENNVIFKFSDIKCRIKATNLPGEFIGNGTITKDNEYHFIVNGEDCKRTYTGKTVILTKI